MRFSAAMTAERLLPQRLALRIRSLLGRIDPASASPCFSCRCSMTFETAALSFTVWRKPGIVMAIFVPAAFSKRGT